MKTVGGFLVVVSFVVGFSSCQKEIDWGLNTPTQGDSVISKFIILDTTFATGLDTSFVGTFTYDASGRLSKGFSTFYNTGVSGPGRFYADQEITYQYSGTQTLPVKLVSEYIEYSPASVTNDTSYLIYTNGYISTDSFTSSIGYYRTNVFNKLSNSRYRMYTRIDNGIGGQSIDTSYINLDIQNGNLMKETDSVWLPGGTWAVLSMTMTYDTKINPAKPFSLPLPAPYYQYVPGNVSIHAFSLQDENNVTKQTDQFGNVLSSLTYEYNNAGLPKIARDVSGFKYLYFYKKL
jgi:hypothetical protein